MVVYCMECVIAVLWSSCTEHYGCVWYGVCNCCIVALLYRTLWLCMVWSVLLLYCGPLVQNIMVVYGMECVIAVSATTAGDIGHEEDLTHLKIREQAERVKEELAGVAGSLTQLLKQLKHCVMSLR